VPAYSLKETILQSFGYGFGLGMDVEFLVNPLQVKGDGGVVTPKSAAAVL
jgi:hypothetical protein